MDKQQAWYQTLEDSGQNVLLLANYDDSHTISASNLRQISMIRRMNYLRDTVEKVVKVDINYSRVEQDLRAANYEADIYICMNGKLVCSNALSTDIWTPFEEVPVEIIQKGGSVETLELYNCRLDIYTIDRDIDMGRFFHQNRLPLLLLVILNLLPPSVFIFWLNRSFVERLQVLTTTVQNADNGVMPLLEQV